MRKKEKAPSLDAQVRMVRDAWHAQFDRHVPAVAETDPGMWPREVYEDRIIVEVPGGLMSYPYTTEDGEIVFGEPERVEIDYRPVKSNALKAIRKDDDHLVVGNYIILFGGRDLEGVANERKNEDGTAGEFFTKATALDSSYTDTGRLYVDWEHGGAPEGEPGRDEVLGFVDWKTANQDDRGVFVERVLNRRNAYMQWLEALIEEGLIGTSSEAVGGTVQRKATGEIVTWPLRRDTMTVTPMEPRMLSENALAALKALNVSVGQEVEAEAESVEDPAPYTTTATTEAPIEIVTTEEKTMSDNENTTAEDGDPEGWEAAEGRITVELDGVKSGMVGVSEQLSGLLEALGKSPSLKDAGFISPDSEGNDRQEQKSFADYLIAIANQNDSRLATVYGSVKAQKALGEQSGTAGGYLVPTEYEARLLQMAEEAGIIRPRATVIPVSSNTGEIPALNQTTAPEAGKGQTAFAGGVRMYWTAEAGTLTSTDPAFEMIEWNINKVGGYTKVSNELMNDSPLALETLIMSLFGRAIAGVEDYVFLRGTGVGMPMGILAAPCTIAITTATNNQFAIADAMAMLARFQPVPGSTSQVWILHRALINDLYTYFQVGTSGTDFVQPRESVPSNLLGYPLLYSEHMPAPDSDDAILADLAAYVIFDNQGMQIAYSEHSAFLTDEGTWRVTKRFDGQPWLSAAITLADAGGATTVSPFLYHDD